MSAVPRSFAMFSDADKPPFDTCSAAEYGTQTIPSEPASEQNESTGSAEMPGGRTVIFIHLYKTGGTTLNRAIEWEYGLNRICSVEPNIWRWHYRRIRDWRPQRQSATRIFKGHMPFGLHRLVPRPATYITVLRDPVERALSDYYFARRFTLHRHHRDALQLNLEEYFLRDHEHNLQSRMLAGSNSRELFPAICNSAVLAQAKDNLARRFAVVGLTERLDETVALLKVVLGWRVQRYMSFRVTRNRPRRETIPPSTIALIDEWERFDRVLYAYGKSLFEKAIDARREQVQAALLKIREAAKMSPLQQRSYFVSSIARAAMSRLYSLR